MPLVDNNALVEQFDVLDTLDTRGNFARDHRVAQTRSPR
jgi:hypothetical protein